MGRHDPPLGSLARDATAPPYHGRHRAPEHTWADTIAEIQRVSNEWPDGIHTCAQLQVMEPGRRPCTCGRCIPAEAGMNLYQRRICAHCGTPWETDPHTCPCQRGNARIVALARELTRQHTHCCGPRDGDPFDADLWVAECVALLEQIAGGSMSAREHMYYPDLPCWCGGMPAFGEPHRVTGRHEAPPLGSAARDATAPPYHGRHRAEDGRECGRMPTRPCLGICPEAGYCFRFPWSDPDGNDLGERAERVADERWSDPEDHQGGPDDV